MRTLARPADVDDVVRRIGLVRADSPRRWGRMTPHQMLCHLADAFRMVRGEKAVTPRTSWLERHVVKWIALYAPAPWPGGRIMTLPELDQLLGGTRPGDFEADRTTLIAYLTAFPAGPLDGIEHAALGRMSRADWLRWGYLHCDHHLRQFGS